MNRNAAKEATSKIWAARFLDFPFQKGKEKPGKEKNVQDREPEIVSDAGSSVPDEQRGNTGINKESLVIRCVSSKNRSAFYERYKYKDIYNDIDQEKSDLLPEGLVVVNFEPPAIPKLISPINDYELAQAHAEALCSKKGSGTIEEMAKAKEILTEACLYIEPEILAFFEYYGVSVDVKESKYPNLKAFYSHMEKTLNITPAFLNSYSGDRTSDSVHPEQVGSLIHEFGHTFDQLLTRHPDSPFLNIKRQTPEQKEYIPIFKRMYRHSKIEETSDGGLLIGGFPYEKAQLDKTRAGSSLPFFPSVLDMLDDFFSEYADEYADEGSEEKFAEFFRARTGVPLYESKLPKEIPADAKTNFPGDDGCIEFARLHPLQLLNDRKLVRAFADRFASEPMEQMDKICAAVIDHVLNTPELLD